MAEQQSNNKGFFLSTLSIKNVKTVLLVMFIIIIGGFVAYQSMPKEHFPEVNIPEIYIGIAKPGSSPKFMADKVAKAVEKEVAEIKSIDEIISNSVNGYTTIRIKFMSDVPVELALQKVKDAVDDARAKSGFPELPVEPNIFELSPSELPIMNINLSGGDVDFLHDIAKKIEEEIERLPEINEVDIRGVQEQEMRIDVDPIKSQARNVSLRDIENAIKQEHVTVSGGELLAGKIRKTIRIEGEFKDAEELKDLVVKQENFMQVKLKDIADVYFGNSDTTSYAREFGKSVVMLDVKKRGGENLLEASDKIAKILEKARKENVIPKGVHVSITNDQSNDTRGMVSNLLNSIVFGVILVVGVLLFFLGLRNAIFVGIAIPLSMLLSFLILESMGVTLNVMVLFSLVLALGMLVDNGIVIIENIYRHMDEGLDRKNAVIKGVGEVAMPIIASTATTVAAFLPLALWPGMMGEFMKFLPITLMIVLGASLFVALVISPVIAVLFMKIETSMPDKKKSLLVGTVTLFMAVIFLLLDKITIGNIFLIVSTVILLNIFLLYPGTIRFQNKFLPKLEAVYERLLAFALKGKRPRLFLIGTMILLVLSVLLMKWFPPKIEFLPVNQPKYVNVFISHPIGTDIEETNHTTLEAEKMIDKVIRPYRNRDLDKGVKKEYQLIQSVISQVGEGASDPSEGVSMGKTPHKARVTINFVESQYRNGIKTSDILKELQSEFKGRFPADIEISVKKNRQGPPQGAPISLDIKGRIEYEDLIAEADKVKSYLQKKNIPGIENLKLNVELHRIEIPIKINREKVRKLNASTGQVGMAIRKALLGQDVAKYTKGEDSYDITIRFNKKNRESLDALLDQELIFRNKKGRLLKIPIRSLIYPIKEQVAYSEVVREDQIPLVRITSNVIEGYNATEIVDEMKGMMKEYKEAGMLSDEVVYSFSGQNEKQNKEMAFLSKALLIAVFLILLIIVAQFNSYSVPVIIMITVVFSLIGVLLGLVISRQDFVIIMTMIGIISLAGVVVNNAIVLIDYTNLLIEEKKKELGLEEQERLPIEEVVKCIVKSGKTRLRPVLLTAITTVLGLIPLAVGFNIDFYGWLTANHPNIYFGGDNTAFFSPMSWAIIYGLTFATFLTLIIVPVLYLLFYKFKLNIYRLFSFLNG